MISGAGGPEGRSRDARPGQRAGERRIGMPWFPVWLLLMNAAAFFLMGRDKKLARQGRRRIPEKTLFLPVLLGGGPGGWLGMYRFRHKTKHWKFKLGIPAVTLLEYGALLLRTLLG